MTLPPIPDSVPSLLGPVSVSLVPELHTKRGKEECLGYFDAIQRTIEIDPESAPVVQWCTFYHEAMHVACWDAGLHNIFTDEQIEIICDVTATQRVAEMLRNAASVV